MSESRVGRLAQDLMNAGYALDFVSDALLDTMAYGNGCLQGTGSAYRALVVPQCLYMPPETIRTMETTILATLMDYPHMADCRG